MSVTEPSICVTIPFHADVDFLAAALRSLVDQDDRDWTAVVVDDASGTVGVAAIAADLHDCRIRVVRNEANLGIAANFNRCLEIGGECAEIVTILHADDMLEPGYIAVIRAAHHAFPSAACVAPRAMVVDASGRPVRTLADSVKALLWPRRLPAVLAGDRGLARLLNGLFFHTPAVSYRLDLLGDVRFDERWRQVMDLDLFARVLLGDGSIALVPDRVYRYRRHAASATSQNSASRLRHAEEGAVTREIVSFAGERGWRRSVLAGRLRPTTRLNARLNDWSSRHR